MSFYSEEGGALTSKTDKWATDQAVFDWLNKELGPFTLDAAADASNAKCKQYLTEEDDALTVSWFNHQGSLPTTVWLNPPYGRDMLKWAEKSILEVFGHGVQRPRCVEILGSRRVVLLVPARTDTRWFNLLAAHAAGIWFIRGRLRFGDATSPAPFPSAVIILDNAYNGPPKIRFGVERPGSY